MNVLFASTHGDPESTAKQKAELEFRSSGKQRRYTWDYDEAFDIYTVLRDGTGVRRLTDAKGDMRKPLIHPMAAGLFSLPFAMRIRKTSFPVKTAGACRPIRLTLGKSIS